MAPVSRRRFIFLAATAICGCQSNGTAPSPGSSGGPNNLAPAADIDAGPAAQFANGTVSAVFASRGFFIVRHPDGRLDAISSVCTHRVCPLTPTPGQGFYCKCHGSTFDPDGHVTQGPAKRDLAHYPISIDPRGHAIVHPGKET